MGFKKETKKRFNFIENTLLKNVTKRIVEIEDKINDLEPMLHELEDEKPDISSISDEISDIRNKLQVLAIEIEKGTNKERCNEISVDDLKILFGQQKDYFDSRIKEIEKKQLTNSSVNKMINDRCNQVLNEITGQITSETKSSPTTIEVDYNRINQQIAITVAQFLASDNRIAQISNSLMEEREKNKKYEQIINDLYFRVKALENNETKSACIIPSVSDSSKSPDEVCEKKLSETNTTVSIDHTPLFTTSNTLNSRRLDMIKDNALALKRNYESILSKDDENIVYFKTVDNLIKKLSKLAEKCSDDELEPSSLSGELVKIFNATILKNFANPKLSDVIDSFLFECGIEKRVIDVGKKLNDEDYEFIGDMPLDVPVNKREQHNTIVEKTHDAYVIYYKDEDGLAYRVLYGQYSIGKFVK